MPAPLHPGLAAALAAADNLILGKSRTIRLAFAGLLAGGHLLLEDLPGVGKTTLAQTLARLCGLDFRRVQFTSDMLPADMLGVSIWDREQQRFAFQHGPVFTQVLLADEINRATPKTQSALLEAMEERQVSIDGITHPLPQPFFVIATQNPSYQIGTFPLPESQLDRFLLRLELGYPDADAERQLLAGGDRRVALSQLQPCLSATDLADLHRQAAAIHTAPALLDYVQALLAASRHTPRFQHGLSPRAGLALLACARAWALLDARDAVLPEDVQTVFPAVARHRLHLAGSGSPASAGDVDELLRSVALP
jgi:MoxR-like ATPase